MSKSEKQRTMFLYADFDRSTSASPKRHSSFARDMMLEQFGKLGHLHDGQWRDHVDITADQLAGKRKLVLWQEPSS